MTNKQQAPGLVQNGESVNWRVKMPATRCTDLDFEWCNYHTKPKKCSYGECPRRINGSFTKKKE